MTSKQQRKWLKTKEFEIEQYRQVLIDHLYRILRDLEGQSIPRSANEAEQS